MATENKDFNYIVRVANTDLDGKKSIVLALQKITGVSFMLANAACSVAGVNKKAVTGELSDKDVAKLTEILQDPIAAGLPTWLLNRRKDPESGEDGHLLVNDLKFAHENDLKRLRKIKSYRGLRHAKGLPVRGQRTSSNFRKNKGKKR